MSLMLYNILLALAWAAVAGRFTIQNFTVGFVVGYLVLVLTRRSSGSDVYISKVPLAIGLVGYFLWTLVRANLRVAYEIITPTHFMRPAVVAVPLDARGDFELLLLTTMITLTPDSLSLEVSPDRKYLYIHSMYVLDAESFRRRIKDEFERRVLEVTR